VYAGPADSCIVHGVRRAGRVGSAGGRCYAAADKHMVLVNGRARQSAELLLLSVVRLGLQIDSTLLLCLLFVRHHIFFSELQQL